MTDELDQADQADDLRALLQSADPASALPTADPARVARLLEDTMTDQLTDESRTDGTRHRSRLTWLVAAAAVVLIGGGVLVAVSQDDDPTPGVGEAGATTSSAAPARTVTELDVEAAESSRRCMTPQSAPEVVSSQTTVVDATVEAISGSTVTLVPSRFYAGDETDVVVVKAPGPEMQALLSAVTFEEGQRYLVAATDGRVTLCGFSAEWTADLAAVYDRAFPA